LFGSHASEMRLLVFDVFFVLVFGSMEPILWESSVEVDGCEVIGGDKYKTRRTHTRPFTHHITLSLSLLPPLSLSLILTRTHTPCFSLSHTQKSTVTHRIHRYNQINAMHTHHHHHATQHHHLPDIPKYREPHSCHESSRGGSRGGERLRTDSTGSSSPNGR
jgi:hypothetical protein